MSPGSGSADQPKTIDPRVPPLVLVLLLDTAIAYLILVRTRCGEDECLDRPVVVAIVSGVALGAAALIIRLRRPGAAEATLRWTVALLWPLAALVVLWALPFDVVFD